jgi:hypothetical protein
MTFADKIIGFNQHLEFQGNLPAGIHIMNPFKENPEANCLMIKFYQKYYNNHHKRHLILGINPGRFVAAVTGIPFTDSKQLLR